MTTVQKPHFSLLGSLLLSLWICGAIAQDIDDSLDVVSSTNRAAEQSQRQYP